jgi:TatD DNase family protein
MKEPLPSLDAHAHLESARTEKELSEVGAALAMSLSLEEAASVARRREGLIAWGVGCHPRKLKAQEAFDAERFGDLAEQTAIVGEIGLDSGARVPMELQLSNFRQALEIVAGMPRVVSIHSYQATGLVIQELKRQPIAIPILHWWTGTALETREAVALGCYFSVHSAVARWSIFRTSVPAERILVESDHGYKDPPAAIPCRIEWVEHLMAQQLKREREEVRRLAWQNLARIVDQTGVGKLLPYPLQVSLIEIGPDESFD